MILPFSTKLNGKPTYFVEKIHKSFRIKEVNLKAAIDPTIHYTKDYNFVAKDKLAAKIHTIREDKNDRWKPGTMIDFFINTRTKDMFRFAPRIPVVSVQKFEIKWGLCKTIATIFIDDVDYATFKNYNDGFGYRDLYYPNSIPARGFSFIGNDGFDSKEDFLTYFNQDFTGKIIHWTDKKY